MEGFDRRQGVIINIGKLILQKMSVSPFAKSIISETFDLQSWLLDIVKSQNLGSRSRNSRRSVANS